MMIMERPLSWAYPAMAASSWLTPSVASITSSAMSAASRCLRAITTESFSAIRWVLPLRRMPAVSMKRKRFAVVLDDLVDRVARGPGNGRDDRSLGSGQPVQQRGFAHVGVPNDRDLGFVNLGSGTPVGFLCVLRVLSG